jgi:hypothetical protein
LPIADAVLLGVYIAIFEAGLRVGIIDKHKGKFLLEEIHVFLEDLIDHILIIR